MSTQVRSYTRIKYNKRICYSEWPQQRVNTLFVRFERRQCSDFRAEGFRLRVFSPKTKTSPRDTVDMPDMTNIILTLFLHNSCSNSCLEDFFSFIKRNILTFVLNDTDDSFQYTIVLIASISFKRQHTSYQIDYKQRAAQCFSLFLSYV